LDLGLSPITCIGQGGRMPVPASRRYGEMELK